MSELKGLTPNRGSMKCTFCTAVILITLALTNFSCRPTPPQPSPPNPTPTPKPLLSETEGAPVTLPVLDALFAQEAFLAEVKSKLQLTDEQIKQVKQIAHDEVLRLRATNAENQSGSTAEARARAEEAIRGGIGEEKTQQLLALARARWTSGIEEREEAGTKEKETKPPEPTMSNVPNNVPSDTRIVVNIPAFRMDIFENGKITKSFKIGIGYPEFPLPTGLRRAQEIIFNPSWTPPDSPWVATMKDVSPGETVKPGSKLNPLGPLKIPIGLPSLIHGGKSPSKIGTFASHGCVGLTNAQVLDFAKRLARISGTQLSDEAVTNYLKNRTKTRVVKLERAIPVELRYETIVVEDGRLHIYRDVYGHGTNTMENLRAVLEANNAAFERLTDDEKNQTSDALAQITGRARPKANVPKGPRNQTNTSAKRSVKNQKEIVIDIEILRDRGYPAPVDLDAGSRQTVTTSSTVTREIP